MNESINTGEWFIPESNLKLPGRLLFDDENNKIILELFGDKYLDGNPIIISDPDRDKRYHSKLYNHNHERWHSVVLGVANGYITLYKCSWEGVQDIGKDLYSVKYKCDFVFFNIHAISVDDLLIESGTFIFSLFIIVV